MALTWLPHTGIVRGRNKAVLMPQEVEHSAAQQNELMGSVPHVVPRLMQVRCTSLHSQQASPNAQLKTYSTEYLIAICGVQTKS